MKHDPDPWAVYLLACAGGRTYTGIAKDPKARFKIHNSGNGAFFTRINAPIEIIALAWLENRTAAARIEYRVKRLRLPQRLGWFSLFATSSSTASATYAAALAALDRLDRSP